MAEETERITGACLCEAVRFEVGLPATFCVHCHCSMCRRNHGAAFVTWFGVAREGLEILEGDDRLVRYASSDHGSRSFCGRCGSSLFCESTSRPDEVDVVLANMHGSIGCEPSLHIFFSDHAPWVEISDALPRLGGATGMEPLDTSGT